MYTVHKYEGTCVYLLSLWVEVYILKQNRVRFSYCEPTVKILSLSRVITIRQKKNTVQKLGLQKN